MPLKSQLHQIKDNQESKTWLECGSFWKINPVKYQVKLFQLHAKSMSNTQINN